MSTLSIIVITILAALAVILLLAAISALAYAHILLRRQITAFSLTVTSTNAKLDQQFAKLDTLIASIHGHEIQEAAKDILNQTPKIAALATRIEQATTIFAGLCRELTGEIGISQSSLERARASGLGPEDYAPANGPADRYVTRSRTSSLDAEQFAAEAAENSLSDPSDLDTLP
jgi:hypothetical protein